MKKILLFILFLSLAIKVFAEGDTPAIRNSRTNIFYIDFDVASNNANSGDTFELGNINDSGIFNSNNDDNNFLSYLGDYQRQEISVEIINDEMIRKVKYYSDKLLYCLYEEIYTKNHYEKWGLRIINKSVVKK